MVKIGSAQKVILSFLPILTGLTFLVTPALAGYGEPGDPAGARPPACTVEKPAKPLLYYTEVIGGNSVKLVWDQSALASSWTAAYGYESGKYVYGVDRFGNNSSRSITIGNLPGGTYYFVVRANNGCMPGPFSNEKVVRIGGGGVVTTTAGAPSTGTPTPTPRSGYQAPTLPGKAVPGKVSPTIKPGASGTVTPPSVLPPPTQTPNFFQRIIDFFRGFFR